MYYATYHGLHDWFTHISEHLGWMILAKEKGYTTKVRTYLESIDHFNDALVEGIKQTEDKDRIRDLKILAHNIKIIQKQAVKILGKPRKSKSKSRRKSRY